MDHADEILDLWTERTRTRKTYSALVITEDGLVLGAGTLLANASSIPQ